VELLHQLPPGDPTGVVLSTLIIVSEILTPVPGPPFFIFVFADLLFV